MNRIVDSINTSVAFPIEFNSEWERKQNPFVETILHPPLPESSPSMNAYNVISKKTRDKTEQKIFVSSTFRKEKKRKHEDRNHSSREHVRERIKENKSAYRSIDSLTPINKASLDDIFEPLSRSEIKRNISDKKRKGDAESFDVEVNSSKSLPKMEERVKCDLENKIISELSVNPVLMLAMVALSAVDSTTTFTPLTKSSLFGIKSCKQKFKDDIKELFIEINENAPLYEDFNKRLLKTQEFIKTIPIISEFILNPINIQFFSIVENVVDINLLIDGKVPVVGIPFIEILFTLSSSTLKRMAFMKVVKLGLQSVITMDKDVLSITEREFITNNYSKIWDIVNYVIDHLLGNMEVKEALDKARAIYKRLRGEESQDPIARAQIINIVLVAITNASMPILRKCLSAAGFDHKIV